MDYEYYTVTEFEGDSIIIIEKESKAICRLFIYDDQPDTGWISLLGVPDYSKKLGIGSFLMSTCESLAKDNGLTVLCLNVLKSSWMHDWYKRLNFTDGKVCDENEEYIQMTKNI